MPTYKTDGIILKRININEADRLLTIYTEKKGKITAVAKGVRKPLSKLAGHLEPFCLVNLVLAEGKNIDTVAGACVRSYHQNIHKGLDEMSRAARFGELIDVLTQDHEENRRLFNLICESLEFLDERADLKIVDYYFLINGLSMLGYCPELYECVMCRGKIGPEIIGWDNEYGGVVCESCGSHNQKVSADTIKALRVMLGRKADVVRKVGLPEKVADEIDALLNDFIVFVNQKELRCSKFLRVLRGESCI